MLEDIYTVPSNRFIRWGFFRLILLLPMLISWRTVAPTLLVAAGAALLVSVSAATVSLQIVAVTTSSALACFLAAFAINRKINNRLVFAALAVFSGLMVLAIPISLYLQTGQWVLTVILAEWGVLMLLVYMIRISHDLWGWVIIGLAPHLSLMLYQGFSHLRGPAIRATGLAENPNIAGGLLAFAAVYLTLKGKWYALPPIIVAIAFSGTRQAFWITVGFLVLLTIFRHLRWRQAIIVFAIVLPSLIILYPQTSRIYYPVLGNVPIINNIVNELNIRLSPPQESVVNLPDYRPTAATLLLPRGDFGDGEQKANSHSVLIRLTYHAGLVGMLIYLGLSLRILVRPKWPDSRWLMLLILALGALDYYPIMPPFSILWWLILSVEKQPQASTI